MCPATGGERTCAFPNFPLSSFEVFHCIKASVSGESRALLVKQ